VVLLSYFLIACYGYLALAFKLITKLFETVLKARKKQLNRFSKNEKTVFEYPEGKSHRIFNVYLWELCV